MNFKAKLYLKLFVTKVRQIVKPQARALSSVKKVRRSSQGPLTRDESFYIYEKRSVGF